MPAATDIVSALMRGPFKSLRCLGRDGAGTTAVEFGLLAVPFFARIFGAVQFGLIAWTQSSMQYAVEKAARCSSVNKTLCGTAAQIQQYAAAQMLASGVGASNFSFTSASCGNQVSASLNYPYLFHLFLPASVTLTAKSCHPA